LLPIHRTQQIDNIVFGSVRGGRLLEQALAGADTRPMGAAAQQKAVDLASREIDKMDDQSATSEERGQRKRRLVKGPREFRGDRPKGAK
jgi:hypothetical protein